MLTVSEGVRQGFRVAADLTARPLPHVETARLSQCEPGVAAGHQPPRQPPRQRRPNRHRPETAPTPPEPPKRITANARCIARELGQLRVGRRAADDLRRTERLRAAFAGELPAFVNDRISQLRRDGVSGTALSDALAELETRLSTTGSRWAARGDGPAHRRPWRSKGSRFNVRNLTRLAGTRRTRQALIALPNAPRGAGGANYGLRHAPSRPGNPRATAAVTVAVAQPEADRCAGKIKPAAETPHKGDVIRNRVRGLLSFE